MEAHSLITSAVLDFIINSLIGSLTFIRIYSGTVKSGTGIYNTSKDKEERVGRMLLMHANSREDIKEANSGDIVALAGLKNTITGHTLSDENNPVLLEPMEFPDPVIEIAVEPKTKGDQEKMGEALGRLAKADPPSTAILNLYSVEAARPECVPLVIPLNPNA